MLSTDQVIVPVPPVAVNWVVWPTTRATLLGLIVSPAPVPVSATRCGVPGALSAIVTVAVRLPLIAGVNVTLIEHVADGATEAPQLLFCAKSPLCGPVIVTPLITSATLPVLVTVTD